MAQTGNKSSRGKLIAVVAVAALVIVLAFVSAFAWPGWAIRKADPTPAKPQATEQPTTPSIEAKPLPEDASELLKAMPDSVLNFARTKAQASETWQSAAPLEEYGLTYATGEDGQDVTLTVAQWSSSDPAKGQYDKLVGVLDGKELASGNVKVSGNTTGSYVIMADESDDAKATAVWQNDTVVFQATGEATQVQRFVQQFPL